MNERQNTRDDHGPAIVPGHTAYKRRVCSAHQLDPSEAPILMPLLQRPGASSLIRPCRR